MANSFRYLVRDVVDPALRLRGCRSASALEAIHNCVSARELWGLFHAALPFQKWAQRSCGRL